MTTVYLEYEKTASVIEFSEDWSHDEVDYKFLNLFLNKKDCRSWTRLELESNDELVRGKQAYVVIVRYQTGGTFGRVDGCATVKGVFSNYEVADALRNSIEDGTYSGHKEWVGYFERLRSVTVETFMVK